MSAPFRPFAELVRPNDAGSKRIIIVMMVFGLIISGLAFAFKIAEFIFTMSSEDMAGSFDVPVTVYFLVAAGWLCLLSWCFVTGKFKNLERVKLELLEMEERE